MYLITRARARTYRPERAQREREKERWIARISSTRRFPHFLWNFPPIFMTPLARVGLNGTMRVIVVNIVGIPCRAERADLRKGILDKRVELLC